MGLVIDKVNALIGIDTAPARLEMQSRTAKLELHQEHARLSIRTEKPKVEIDQYEAFASAGLKNNYDLTREAADRGYQQAMEYIAKKAQDGDRLANIKAGGSPIADTAQRDASPQKEFVLAFIPSTGPRFNVIAGSVSIEPGNSGIWVETEFVPNELSMNYTPAKMNIYMKQYASISFRYEGEGLDMKV